ncbi:hypothetical protein BD779DRAFT_1519784 [Infundibulicybe gibba]|nr:hypothetical protein BD779DRAFT_1519784 [Infundibulicybe gibba]
MAAPHIPVPKEHPAIELLDHRATDHNRFITHLDRSSVYAKIIAFQAPLWSNVALCGLLIWRGMKGTSRYILTKPNPTPTSWTWIIINGIIDLCLYKFVWPGVRTFITSHLWLRLRWGFRETEVVFRKPSDLQRTLLSGLAPEEFKRQYADILYQAIDPKLVFENAGFLTKNNYWTLEYNAIGDAYSLMAAGELDIKTWDLKWHVQEFWRLHDDNQLTEVAGVIFMEKLRSVGGEDIVRQWESIRTSGESAFQSGGTALDLLEREGISFEELWADAMREAAAAATDNINWEAIGCFSFPPHM